MTKQQQEATDNSLAIQSGGDTVITHGVSLADMAQILDTLSRQLQTYTEVAKEIVDARLTEFKSEIIHRFSQDQFANSDAFKDPDFQYLLTRAQHAYARSGDKGIRDVLVDLIGQRSKQTDRNRLTLSLNDAVEKSAILTSNEFAELSLVYLFRNTIHHGVNNVPSLAQYFNRYVSPLLPDISEENSSYLYLQAQSCASISFASSKLDQNIKDNYGGVLSRGFDKDQFIKRFPNENVEEMLEKKILVPCINDSKRMQINAVNKLAFSKISTIIGLNEEKINEIWGFFRSTFWSREEMIVNIGNNFQDIGKLFSIWENTSLKSLHLTSTGIAIAHANLVRVSGFEADLSIWIN